MSQERFGKELGVSRQAVHRWESGRVNPGVVRLALIAEWAGLKLSELVALGEE